MSRIFRSNCFPLRALLRRFGGDARGNIAVIFGLSSTLIFLSMGAGLDLSRAYLAGQKLSEVATLTCQYASRPSVLDTSTASYNGSNGGAAYVSQVNGFLTNAWQGQKVNLTQTNGTPFSYTQGGAATVNLSASMPTTFMGIAGFQTIPISVQNNCYDKPSSIVQRVADSNSQYVVKESFEAGGIPGSYTFYKPDGSTGLQSTPTTYSNTKGYTGADGTKWGIAGYCLEQDAGGVIKSSAFDGNYSVELDCDNGSGNKGNSSISTLTYLAAGTYELRYAYASRIGYPNYAWTYLCGSTAGDMSWANDNAPYDGPISNASRTNQINVYLDLNTSTNQPPAHTTIDGTQQLAGSNLIDMCVYSLNWVQRSVSISVTTPGYYWLSFAADGTSDSYGGQLDDIRLCRVSCPGTVKDNFPVAWTAGTTLFQDQFQSPTYTVGYYGYTENGNMSNSVGTSGASSGWSSQTASGWNSAPINKATIWSSANYTMMCPTSASQCVEMSGSWNTNSLMSRPFLLEPGYYQVNYKYRSVVSFANLTSTYCGTTPAAANISTLSGISSAGLYINVGGIAGVVKNDTNTVGVFMSHAQLASTPNATSTWGASATYTNTDGTTTTLAKNAPNAVSLTNYDSSQVNPLLDICGYSPSWQSRSRNIFIQKPAFYWLTVSDLATSDGIGGIVDGVTLTALGSPYMSSPPTAVTIPVPSPQPSTSIYYTGFSITANPLAP